MQILHFCLLITLPQILVFADLNHSPRSPLVSCVLVLPGTLVSRCHLFCLDSAPWLLDPCLHSGGRLWKQGSEREPGLVLQTGESRPWLTGATGATGGQFMGGNVCTWHSVPGPGIRPGSFQVGLTSVPGRVLRVSSPSGSNYKHLSVLFLSSPSLQQSSVKC